MGLHLKSWRSCGNRAACLWRSDRLGFSGVCQRPQMKAQKGEKMTRLKLMRYILRTGFRSGAFWWIVGENALSLFSIPYLSNHHKLAWLVWAQIVLVAKIGLNQPGPGLACLVLEIEKGRWRVLPSLVTCQEALPSLSMRPIAGKRGCWLSMSDNYFQPCGMLDRKAII